ncbi:MAG: T9SS type A sorting domain-containing protein, partial [Bacteroidota bacterium]
LFLPAGPNPARSSVSLEVASGASGPLRVTLLDLLGREVHVVHDGPSRPHQRLRADTSTLAPGVYVLVARAGSRVQTQALTVVQ